MSIPYFYNTRDLVIMLGLQDIAEEYRTETGYITRTGITRFRSGLARMFYPQSNRKRLMTDFLASFTYIPGTVIHIGYGSLYEKIKWEAGEYRNADSFLETKRGFFFKASFLWRM